MTNSTELKIIDWTLGEKLVAGNRKMAEEMLQMLKSYLPEHLTEITEAYQANDYPSLAERTHKLHGATCYCGTPRLKEAAKQLEKAIRDGKEKNIHKLYNELCLEINAVLQA